MILYSHENSTGLLSKRANASVGTVRALWQQNSPAEQASTPEINSSYIEVHVVFMIYDVTISINACT